VLIACKDALIIQKKLATVINMGRGINKKNFLLMSIAFAIIMTAYLTLADSDVPYGIRTINYIDSSRPNLSSYLPDDIEAEAGNVTEITLDAIATTKTWQGYYGNITGIITLEDAYGYVFYNWTSAEPKGEIYASINNSVTWLDIRCFDWEIGTTGQNIDMQHVEDNWFGIPDDASDGLNDTYTQAGDLDNELFVGTVNITESTDGADSTCHSTNTYRYGQMSTQSDFENVLLTDGDVLVFTTIIENNILNNETDIFGFDNREHDFQLLVAENGRSGFEDTTTTYYFWAEIE
jgi:hypothetical protein